MRRARHGPLGPLIELEGSRVKLPSLYIHPRPPPTYLLTLCGALERIPVAAAPNVLQRGEVPTALEGAVKASN